MRFFFFSSRRRHTRWTGDWSSDVCSSDLMGLERIAAVLQGTHDNYAIDLFRVLIQTIADLTKVSANGPHKASHRVIADHRSEERRVGKECRSGWSVYQ